MMRSATCKINSPLAIFSSGVSARESLVMDTAQLIIFLNASTSGRFGHQKPASGALASFLNAASVITTTGDKDAIRRSHC